MRTVINNDRHYLRNFRPQRWPFCDPKARLTNPGHEGKPRAKKGHRW